MKSGSSHAGSCLACIREFTHKRAVRSYVWELIRPWLVVWLLCLLIRTQNRGAVRKSLSMSGLQSIRTLVLVSVVAAVDAGSGGLLSTGNLYLLLLLLCSLSWATFFSLFQPICPSVCTSHSPANRGTHCVPIMVQLNSGYSVINCEREGLAWGISFSYRCHRREWLPSYVTPGHWCLGVNYSWSLTPRCEWLPEHFYLGMNDSPG